MLVHSIILRCFITMILEHDAESGLWVMRQSHPVSWLDVAEMSNSNNYRIVV